MHNIPVYTVIITAGGHSNKKAVRAFNDFDVMQGNCVIQRDGNNCAQPPVMQQSANFHIGNIYHTICSVSPTSVLSARLMRRCVSAQP